MRTSLFWATKEVTTASPPEASAKVCCVFSENSSVLLSMPSAAIAPSIIARMAS